MDIPTIINTIITTPKTITTTIAAMMMLKTQP